jgi:hypothetical protein
MVGEYRVLHQLGAGTFGEVYAGERAIPGQHDSWQTRRPSGHVVGSSTSHTTMHVPASGHVTEHAPAHPTWQSETPVQSAEPPSPSSVTQVAVFSQVKTQPAPHWPLQLVASEHWIRHWSPHPIWQILPWVHEKLQPGSSQNASHMSAPAHWGAQPGCAPQSSRHEP